MSVVVLRRGMDFPDPEGANADGLVAVGGDLSVGRLLRAYRHGLFPWTANPVTWWSPDPRAIFEFEQFRVSRSLRRLLRKDPFRISRDAAFEAVMAGCAASAPGRRETWITEEFRRAYYALHTAGYAHSLECWQGDRLAGGIYGVSIGGFFAGESMFHTVNDASKVALFHLLEHLRARGFALFDIQMLTPITKQLGAVCIPRRTYLERLRAAVAMASRF